MSMALLLIFLFVGVLLAGILLVVTSLRGNKHGPSVGPQCGRCNYNLTGATSNRCPECGVLFIEGGVRMQARRSKARLAAGSLMIILPLLFIVGAGLTSLMLVRARTAQSRAVAVQQRAIAQAAAQYTQVTTAPSNKEEDADTPR